MRLIIVLDIETTGLSPIYDMICEIGIVLFDLDSGYFKPLFNQVVYESDKYFDKDCWIIQNSDLTYKKINHAKELESFRPILQFIFDLNFPITAFNQSFDFGFLERRDYKIQNKFWDPMLKLTPIIKLRRYNGDYKWPSVQEAWSFFFPNSKYHENHRALDDAIHEAKIIHKTHNYLREIGVIQ